MKSNIKLSVVINTKNMADTLKATLESVAEIADQIVVVDMKSTDGTPEVAKAFTDEVYTFEQELGYADPARNMALSKAKGEWILVLDADEELTAPACQAVKDILAEHASIWQDFRIEPETVCFFFPRQNMIFGTWVEHTGWWPDYQPRLFKKGTVSWQKGVHRLPDIVGPSQYLPAHPDFALLHHNYPTVEAYLERLNRYTSIAASEQSNKKPLMLKTTQVWQTFHDEFLRRYFAQDGIKDGPHGLSLSLLQATYQLSQLLKNWQKNGFKTAPESPEEIEQQLRQFQSELAYWLADAHVKQSQGLTRLWWQLRRKLRI